MPLAILLDEHLRGTLWRAIQHHNARGSNPLDVVRVGDPENLPLGSLDPEILLWAEREERILVSEDRKPLPPTSGGPSSGRASFTRYSHDSEYRYALPSHRILGIGGLCERGS
jgi:hypothetical protein